MPDPTETDAPERRSARLSLLGLIDATVTLTACASLVSLLGASWWVLDLLTHFRLQYAVAFLAASMVYAGLRMWRRLVACGVLLVVQLVLILPLYWGELPPANGKPTFEALLVNIYTGHPDPARVVTYLSETEADIVVLEELGPQWLPMLEEWRQAYPYVLERPQTDNFGIGLYSRYPIVKGEVTVIGEAGVASIVADIEFEGTLVQVIATHPVPPVGREYTAWRNGQLRQLAQTVAQRTLPVLLIGDLNTSSWAPVFRRLIRDSGLRDSRQGVGVQPTWPAQRWWMRIPLDHVLISKEVAIHGRRVGPDIGSDHLPVHVTFGLSPTP